MDRSFFPWGRSHDGRTLFKIPMPESSELYYGDREEPGELKPIRNARLIEGTEFKMRGLGRGTCARHITLFVIRCRGEE